MQFEFADSYFVLIHLELKQEIRSFTPVKSLENHTRHKTKIGKVDTRFLAKKAPKPYPLGRHMPIWLI